MWGPEMAARFIATSIALLMAVGAEWSTERLSFGMFFLFVAICIWHGWSVIAAGYTYLGDSKEFTGRQSGIEEPKVERDIAMYRLGPLMIRKPRLK